MTGQDIALVADGGKKIYLILSEGSVTERSYFEGIRSRFKNAQLICYGSNKASAPLKLLKRMKILLKRLNIKGPFEAWILMDRNSWKKEHLDAVVKWASENPNFHVAISNPKFEYWILLHFQNAGSVSSRECSRLLSKHLPHFEKELRKPPSDDQIALAVKRARQKDNPPCAGWPRDPGQTTVYRLMESIRRTEEGGI